MYLMLTEKCNMRCDHCCFACGPKGSTLWPSTGVTSMPWEVFTRAVDMSLDYEDCLVLGGGEPTLWKEFRRGLSYLDEVVQYGHSVLMITNGTRERNTFAYIRHMEKAREYDQGEWNLSVSYNDGYHDERMMSEKVYYWCADRVHRIKERNKREYSHVYDDTFRTVTRIHRNGRAEGLDLPDFVEGCGCSGPIVRPSGEIRFCGCRNSPIIGSIQDGLFGDGGIRADCWAEIEEEERQEVLASISKEEAHAC